MASSTLISILSVVIAALSLIITTVLAWRMRRVALYASVCFISHADTFDEYFLCLENAGPGDALAVSCRLESDACIRHHANIPAGGDVVLTMRVPHRDTGMMVISYRRAIWPRRTVIRHIPLKRIPMLKNSHHRSDFMEGDATIIRIIERSANEPDDRCGPIRLKDCRRPQP